MPFTANRLIYGIPLLACASWFMKVFSMISTYLLDTFFLYFWDKA